MKNYDLIIASGASICYNKKAKDFTAFKTGGKIDVLIMPTSIENFVIALNNTNNPIILGNTTNSLISDNGISKEVILTTKIKGVFVEGDCIIANAGELLSNVCNVAKANCLAGLETFVGIPGTIGGAICMNASAFGYEISDFVQSVTAFVDGKIVQLDVSDCGFGYRKSIFNNSNIVVLSVKFKLNKSNQIIIANSMKKYKSKRKIAQPNEISLGSVFKKVNSVSAGYYIEKCGLKNAKKGGCIVSPKHANFIVNIDNATSDDFAKLAHLCQTKVLEKFDIHLDREVIYFGEFNC